MVSLAIARGTVIKVNAGYVVNDNVNATKHSRED